MDNYTTLLLFNDIAYDYEEILMSDYLCDSHENEFTCLLHRIISQMTL